MPATVLYKVSFAGKARSYRSGANCRRLRSKMNLRFKRLFSL